MTRTRLAVFDMAGTTVDDRINGGPLVLKSYDDACKANGFKDYKDFCAQGAKWDATKFSAALTKATEDYSKKLEEHNKKKTDEAADKNKKKEEISRK